jgi:general secretion pathway protein G
MFLKNRKGVTLTELVVVMAVLSVLASVAMPVARYTVKRTKEAELRRALREMRDAIDYYKKLSDEGRIKNEAGSTGYPKTLEKLVEGETLQNPAVIQPGQTQLPAQKKYRFLRKIPVDPMTGKAEWGMRSNEDEPDSSVWGEQDVYDV